MFAFGLLLLELLSGRRAMEARIGSEIGMLSREIRAVLEAGDKREAKLIKWMDPALGSEYQSTQLSAWPAWRGSAPRRTARRPKKAMESQSERLGVVQEALKKVCVNWM